jgi:hypothetical protein
MASIVPKDPQDNSDWDVDSSPPDVVVELKCPPLSGDQVQITRTPEVSSLTPQWTSGGCTVLASRLVSQPIEIKLIDIDNVFDDEMSSTTYQIDANALVNGILEIPIPAAVNSLTIRLSRYQAP